MSWQDWLSGPPRRVTKYDSADDPLTLESVRDNHLRVTSGNVENDYINTLIEASLDMAQRETQRRILPETWKLVLRGFPWCIEPPFPPLIEVTSIQYYDEDGALQTLATSVYRVTTTFGPEAGRGLIELADGESWPETAARPDAVQVTFRCGYVDSSVSPEAVDVPALLNQARLLVIKDLYESRGSAAVGVGVGVTPNVITAQRIFWSYRDPSAAG